MAQGRPQLPQLALTVALAGKRNIPPEMLADLGSTLTLIFDTLGQRLGALRAGTADPGNFALRFSCDLPARMTLITGLADGADQLASGLFTRMETATPSVERALGAVLPCARAEFVAKSAVRNGAEFDRLAGLCEFILELDGMMPPRPAEPDSPDARRHRAQTFQAQSEFLLRQADILIAVDQPDDIGSVGGTRQAVRASIGLGTPVILVQLGRDGIAILHSQADFDEPVPLRRSEVAGALGVLIDGIIGIPGAPRDPAYAASLLQEFYAADVPAPVLLNHVWNWFEGLFWDGQSLPASTPWPPYRDYRNRASTLSRLYAGRYRGAFLMGYALAVVAVTLALCSLCLMLAFPGEHGSPDWIWRGLFVLGLLKLAIVIGIARLVNNANHRRLAHRAADYRYLSERLRAMMFLPIAGSLRPPLPWSLPYTTRVAAQGVMDRLFLSVARQSRPLTALDGHIKDRAITLDAATAMKAIRDDWLTGQERYHLRNRQTLTGMSHWLERLGRRLNLAVIGVVLLDLVILTLDTVDPHGLVEPLRRFGGPTFVLLAAIFPAAVASLNGVRFQSECGRLADRSEQMAAELARLISQSNLTRQKPVRLLDALRLGEDAARLTLDEVAEWSAIYGKEVMEM